MENLQIQLINAGTTILALLIPLGAAYLTQYLKGARNKIKREISKIKDDECREMFNNALDLVNEITFNAVVNAENTMVKEVKEISEDGKVERRELINIGVQVKEGVINQLKPEMKKALSYGIADLEGYISNKVETQLASIKGQL